MAAARDGLADFMDSIERLPSPRDADERSRHDTAVLVALEQTLLSMAMAGGELAFHLRRITAGQLVANSAVRAN